MPQSAGDAPASAAGRRKYVAVGSRLAIHGSQGPLQTPEHRHPPAPIDITRDASIRVGVLAGWLRASVRARPASLRASAAAATDPVAGIRRGNPAANTRRRAW